MHDELAAKDCIDDTFLDRLWSFSLLMRKCCGAEVEHGTWPVQSRCLEIFQSQAFSTAATQIDKDEKESINMNACTMYVRVALRGGHDPATRYIKVAPRKEKVHWRLKKKKITPDLQV